MGQKKYQIFIDVQRVRYILNQGQFLVGQTEFIRHW